MTPHNAAKLARQSLTVRVMASLLKQGAKIHLSCTRRPMNRRQALDLERKTISRLLARGFLLTNFQQNPFRHKDVGKAVRAIRRKRGKQ
jgi:hypothetical protein